MLYRTTINILSEHVSAKKMRRTTSFNTFIFVKDPYQPLDKAIIRQLGEDMQVKSRPAKEAAAGQSR